MKNRWNSEEAEKLNGDLALRVYSSRLLGEDPALVLHGGGNTSVKIRETNLVGEQQDVLYVKGSGWDLSTIEAAGFAPVRMAHLLKLARLERLSDSEMVNELKTHLTDAGAPGPSVETILHAILPYKFVDHTHADAVIAVTNSVGGEARVRDIYGDRVVIVPYVMPGFDLARVVYERFDKESTSNTEGVILMNHGIFSFGESAQQSYDRMIELVGLAEEYLLSEEAWHLPVPSRDTTKQAIGLELAELRNRISAAAGFPLLLSCHQDAEALAFARRNDLAHICQQGPATPDHVIRTKRLPMLGRDVDAFVAAYRAYFEEHSPNSRVPVTMLDPAPRVILDPGFGLCTAGRTATEADINADIYRHTMEIIQRAEMLGGYKALPEFDIFEVEYWELEQAKLKKSGVAPPFAGEVALVTGAASGIGRACVESLLQRGAAVVGLDRDEKIEHLHDRADFLGISCDLIDSAARDQSIEAAVRRFGGLDMLILNAGVFPGGCLISELADQTWRQVMEINVDANLALMRECHPLLKLAPNNGRVVVIGSKNVPAPGPGAAAYSASKAALNQLARVAALEWGSDGIRINTLHPDAVFDTALWSQQVLEARARHYGMPVEEYKTKNILKTEVRSRDVAELAAELCGRLFSKTTGAQIPIDGGNDRVI